MPGDVQGHPRYRWPHGLRTVGIMIESGDMIESPQPEAPDDGPSGASGAGADSSAPLPPPDAVHHRIWRSPDRVLTGAAGGLAAALGVDAVWTRMAFVVLQSVFAVAPSGNRPHRATRTDPDQSMQGQSRKQHIHKAAPLRLTAEAVHEAQKP